MILTISRDILKEDSDITVNTEFTEIEREELTVIKGGIPEDDFVIRTEVVLLSDTISMLASKTGNHDVTVKAAIKYLTGYLGK